ncbi:MAG: dihydrodipicolinate synthase family protein [Martelella sp.]|uniref:dihydrodipicolinate synthase family protein n=1 Tax=unclassified Martelella TaxID=2629616 RepID=UPI000C37C742|nr:dihydrodipicolinate synthase family protein [Martelella sp.]MAU23191.1 dihydrodipicolinate synthase family protein [Martelella sp.]
MKGIIAAVPTPVDGDGRALQKPFLEHCRWALANGCDGLNVLGTTGEANSLGIAERKAVMGWAAQNLDPARLMVGTGLTSLADTLELTRAAADMGYRIALVLPPFYYKPVSDDGLYAWYMALDEALGESPIAIWFYNFPQMTGVPIPVDVVARLAAARPARFAGIKDSSGDLAYCRSLVAAVPGLSVFPSSETALAEMQASGFAGCISATVNISAPLCAAYLAAPGEALAARIAETRGKIAAHPLVPAVKYLVGKRSGDPVWENVLPPFTQADAPSRAALDAI